MVRKRRVANFAHPVDLYRSVGEPGQRQRLAKYIIVGHYGSPRSVYAHSGQVLDDHRQVGQSGHQFGEFCCREILRRPAHAD